VILPSQFILLQARSILFFNFFGFFLDEQFRLLLGAYSSICTLTKVTL